MFVLLNLCEFRDLHVFFFGKIIVVSIPDNVLQSQIRKKNYEMFVIVQYAKISRYTVCIGNEILPPTFKKYMCDYSEQYCTVYITHNYM